MSNDKQIELMKKKAGYYFDLKKQVHITLNNRNFLNGSIKEIKVDFLMFDDFLNGEMPVFFLEIFEIEPYENKKPVKKLWEEE